MVGRAKVWRVELARHAQVKGVARIVKSHSLALGVHQVDAAARAAFMKQVAKIKTRFATPGEASRRERSYLRRRLRPPISGFFPYPILLRL